jgi:hypothetical protein
MKFPRGNIRIDPVLFVAAAALMVQAAAFS